MLASLRGNEKFEIVIVKYFYNYIHINIKTSTIMLHEKFSTPYVETIPSHFISIPTIETIPVTSQAHLL